VPMMIFAIVFGLSMDYEVFLLSRVHEAWIETGDAHRSVAVGIGATARVITTAAAIMVTVFASFVLDDDPTVKMLAIGMAFAVLIDASLVRMILVPSVMSLLGPSAWYIPRWLDRILPQLELEGSTAAPQPAPEPEPAPEPKPEPVAAAPAHAPVSAAAPAPAGEASAPAPNGEAPHGEAAAAAPAGETRAQAPVAGQVPAPTPAPDPGGTGPAASNGRAGPRE
jgi:MMPL family